MLLCSTRIVAGLALFGPIAPVATGQSMRAEFEVASIKPHNADDGVPHISIKGDPGRINYTNVTVRSLIRQAYGLKIYPLAGGTDALSTDRYDIVATVVGAASKERAALMLQSLLAERFKLALHRETKELPIYALVVSKTGIKIREVPDDGSDPEIGIGGGHQINAHHISMKMLASSLQGYIGDPVVDTTGLAGLYDLNLDFNPDESMSAEGGNIFEAVQQQLGLKLERRKGQVEVVVVDHVEKPSKN